MKVLIAPDSFKHSITAKEAAEAIYRGARKVFPELDAILMPLSDGGEGFTETLVTSAGGVFADVKVHDALMRNIGARIGLLPDGNTAIVELAEASGIELLSKDELNPMVTSTFGVGELILAALDNGCKKIIIGLGGSATNDGGVGMARALGVRFYDEGGRELGHGGGALGNLARIDASGLDQRLAITKIVVACDVTNVLYGPHGASLVYGPQKGADASMAEQLDRNLEHYAQKLKLFCGCEIGTIPGSGAAGGSASSLMAFLGASIVPGFNLVKDILNLEEIIRTSTLIVTGEGRIDKQTAFGKVPGALAKLASHYHVPVVAFAGLLGEGYEELYKKGFTSINSIIDLPMPIEEAIHKGALLLEKASERFFRDEIDLLLGKVRY